MRLFGFLSILLPAAAGAQILLLSGTESERLRQADPQAIQKAADEAMSSGPWSVRDHRPADSKASTHDFYSSAEFDANRQDLHSTCDAVLTLGSAAWLTGERRYARRAAELLNAWFLDPKTYMNPDLDFSQSKPGERRGRGFGVIDGRDLLWCAQGMAFAERSPGWNPQVGDRVRGWFRRYVCWLMLSRKSDEEKSSNDVHAAWWAAQVAAYADLVNDGQALAEVWKLVDSGKARLDLDPQASSLVAREALIHGQPAGNPAAEASFPGTAWDRILQALTATPRQEHP
jgi:hypothetical protein